MPSRLHAARRRPHSGMLRKDGGSSKEERTVFPASLFDSKTAGK